MKKFNLSEFLNKKAKRDRIFYGNGKAEGEIAFEFNDVMIDVGDDSIYCSGDAEVKYYIVSDSGGELDPPHYEENLEVKLNRGSLKCEDIDGNPFQPSEEDVKKVETALENGETARDAIAKYMEDAGAEAAYERKMEEKRYKDYDY